MTNDAGPPIYQFKPIVECFLTEKQGMPCVMEANGQKFTLVGPALHPDGGQPTYLAEIWSGVNDGLRFWLEPGWYERLPEWCDVV
jgi:hypothetical protein